MSIIVGADGSPDSELALRWAGQLAQQTDREVVAMTGFAPRDADLREHGVEKLLAEQKQRLESYSDPARLDGVVVRTVVEEGDARPGILSVAEREKADLIVVGRVGLSAGPGALHTGSMPEWLAHNTTRPLAVITGTGDQEGKRILLAVDGSEGSKAAAAWAGEYASSTNVGVYAASVAHQYVEWTPSTSIKNWRRSLERNIREEFAAELSDVGVDVIPLALEGGNFSRTLLDAAEKHDAGLIVAGCRGFGGFVGARVGGVALKLLHGATGSIVLVPVPQD